MSSQPLEITIAPAITKEDFLSFARIEDAAFGGEMMHLMFGPTSTPPNHLPAATRHYDISQTDPTAKYLVARLPSPSNQIIAGAKWNFFLEDPPKPQYPWPKEEAYDPPANREMLKWFFGELDRKRNEVLGDKKHFLMAILVVHPEFQRRHVGKKLLEWGLEIADRDGIDVWIDASPAGKGLYEKMGWKQVGAVDTDLGKWGGKEGEVGRTVNMVRAPKRST